MEDKFSNLNINPKTVDPLLVQGLSVFLAEKRASITLLQRHFAIGYAKASNIMEQMEKYGFVSPSGEDYTRQILISKEEYEKIFKK